MTARALQRWTTLHRWSSLFCTLNLMLLLLTGLPLIFHHEIDAALGVFPKVETNGAAAVSMDRAVELARATKTPAWLPSTYFEDDEHPGLAAVALLPPGEKDFTRAEPVYVNLARGVVIPGFDPEKTFTGWLLRLHSELFLGLGGSLYLALVGLAFFVALVSGALVYAPFLRGLRLGDLRRGRGRRVFHLDLHNLVGAVSLGWCSVVALTGVILELSRPAAAIYQFTDLARMTAPYKSLPPPAQLAPLEVAAASARASWPGCRVAFVAFPGTPFSGEHHYAFFMAAERGLAKRVFKTSLIDAATGKLTVASEAPWYIKGLLVSGPLHFGDYGGLPLKIIWTLFALMTLGLAVGGVYLTLARGRSRQRHRVGGTCREGGEMTDSPWKWPALLGLGSVFALIAALLAEGSLGWDVVCWALLLAPVAVVVRALYFTR